MAKRRAAKAEQWNPEASRREVYLSFCETVGLPPEALEHVASGRTDDWQAEAEKLLASEGRYLSRPSTKDASIVRGLERKLFVAALLDSDSTAKLEQLSGGLQGQALATWLLQQCLSRGRTLDEIERATIPDLLAVVDVLTAAPPPPKGEAVYLGNRRYQVGTEPPLVLQDSEDTVLQALIIELGGSGSITELRDKSGKPDAARVLKSIKQKRRYKSLAPFIFMPGGKGKGGYRTTIRPR